jgi:hypothetical protein
VAENVQHVNEDCLEIVEGETGIALVEISKLSRLPNVGEQIEVDGVLYVAEQLTHRFRVGEPIQFHTFYNVRASVRRVEQH